MFKGFFKPTQGLRAFGETLRSEPKPLCRFIRPVHFNAQGIRTCLRFAGPSSLLHDLWLLVSLPPPLLALGLALLVGLDLGLAPREHFGVEHIAHMAHLAQHPLLAVAHVG